MPGRTEYRYVFVRSCVCVCFISSILNFTLSYVFRCCIAMRTSWSNTRGRSAQDLFIFSPPSFRGAFPYLQPSRGGAPIYFSSPLNFPNSSFVSFPPTHVAPLLHKLFSLFLTPLCQSWVFIAEWVRPSLSPRRFRVDLCKLTKHLRSTAGISVCQSGICFVFDQFWAKNVLPKKKSRKNLIKSVTI